MGTVAFEQAGEKWWGMNGAAVLGRSVLASADAVWGAE